MPCGAPLLSSSLPPFGAPSLCRRPSVADFPLCSNVLTLRCVNNNIIIGTLDFCVLMHYPSRMSPPVMVMMEDAKPEVLASNNSNSESIDSGILQD
ncbi:hypothetical protein C1H46_032906 [Malus baccata]|uniref:Uncharacterized protein n=1 Tax=Malus baccata TaxID=106549 RepID=A0A540L4Z0_MALBA|nr:hypothetical protein C1H46_032906 [Malus baccata]